MSTLKAFSTGSVKPPLAKGIIRLYGMRFCPYVYRVRLVLAIKQVQYETVNINLQAKPEWYLTITPTGKVPLLQWDDHKLMESLIIADYLDEKYPQNPLWPKDPYLKAVGKIFIENFNRCDLQCLNYMQIPMLSYKLYSEKDVTAFDKIKTEFASIEKHLSSNNTTYLFGNNPGMVDYMVWPFLEDLASLWQAHLNKEMAPEAEFPLLSSWIKRLQQDKFVQQCSQGQQLHQHILMALSGKHFYDIGL